LSVSANAPSSLRNYAFSETHLALNFISSQEFVEHGFPQEGLFFRLR